MNKHKRVCLICLYLVYMASIVSHAQQDRDINSLIQQFDHPEAVVHHSAAWDTAGRAQRSLVEIGNEAVPALIVALNHKNPVVRRRTAMVLNNLWRNNERIIHDLSKLKPLDPNVNNTPLNEDIVRHNEDIVRALLKASKDDDDKVRSEAMGHLLNSSAYFSAAYSSEDLVPVIIPGLVHSLYYGSPFFDPGIVGGMTWHKMAEPVRAALTETLYSSEWSLRFGAAIAYGKAFRPGRNSVIRNENPPPEAKKAVVSTLAEGLTHPDWKARQDAMYVLSRLGDDFDGAKQALESLPPFGITFQTITIKNREVVKGDFLKSLNTDGITFKFNRPIYYDGEITIQPVDGEPLGWNVEKSSHSVTITPPEGKELVKGRDYIIQLRDFMDVAWNEVDAEIEFSTVPLNLRHLHQSP